MAAARNSPTKKLGGNPLRRIFSRSKKHELEPVDESSPLMDNGQYTSISGSDRSSSYDPEQGLQQESKKETAKQNWQVLRRHVLEGDFLLRTSMQQKEDVTVDPDNVQARAQEHKIQKKIDEIRSGTEFSLWHGLVMIFIYLAISVAFYNTVFEPDWTMLDSMYFAMVTVTTVGYGVEIPSTDASRIFTCFYALSGVCILGIALGVVGSNLVDAQEAMANKAEDMLMKQVMSVFDARAGSGILRPEDLEEEDARREEEMIRHPSLIRSTLSFFRSYLPLLAIMLGMAYWIGHRAGWSLLEIFYYTIITSTTVGYGDYAPRTEEEKMIAIFFIPIAVGAMGVWLSGVANIIVESRSARYRKSMIMKELTQHDLDIMDRDGDGIVTRAEFLEFMLVAMNKIDQNLVDDLRSHFDQLDADGTGELTRDDLVEVARRKLKRPSHKLKLGSYKQRLLEQGRGHQVHRRRSSMFNTEWSTRFFTSFDSES